MTPRRGAIRSMVPSWLRRGVFGLLAILVLEYVVVPELVGASKNLDLLSRLNPIWLVVGVVVEGASLVCYALLTRTLLPSHSPPLGRLIRIVLATTAVAHVVPGGAVGGTGLGYQLLTADGVDNADAGFTLATQAIGSAIVLNVMLWIALVISIPIAGVHPIYVVIALVGMVAMLAAGGLVYTFTRGEERAIRAVRGAGKYLPRVGADRLEQLVRDLADSLTHLASDRALLRRAVMWAGLNWLLDAASLWAFLAALGRYVNPVELFAAYGIANVLGAIPITPGGLGIIEASAGTLIVSFGVARTVATLGVLGWRLVNFWLPIPIGALSYLSLKVPRGGGLSAHRHALSTMTRDAKAAPPPPPDDARANG